MTMSTPVVDFHSHVGGWRNWGFDDDAETYLAIMDAAGVDVSCINCIFHGDASIGNDVVADRVRMHPDRFVGVAFVTPHYGEEAISELDRCFDELNMKFLKVYAPYWGRPIDDEGFDPIFEWANDRGIVVMSHANHVPGDDVLTSPHRFVALARRFDRVTWVLAHSGGGRQGQRMAVDAALECPNILLETATSFAEHGSIEFLVEGIGADRILYGSDMPLFDARYQLGRIATAAISVTDKKKILGLNAMRLLGLEFETRRPASRPT